MVKGTFYGIGVGPGDPGLLTFKAAETMSIVDLIALPDSGSASAVTQIIERVCKDPQILFLDMPMTRDKTMLDAAHDAAWESIAIHLDAGRSVAFLTLGDPSLYSTFTPLQKRALAAGFAVDVIPGVISPCAVAAKANVPLAERNESVTIVPALDESDLPETNIVLMKVGKRFDWVKRQLEKTGRARNAVMVQRCGMPGEKIDEDILVAEPPDSYFTTILVGPTH